MMFYVYPSVDKNESQLRIKYSMHVRDETISTEKLSVV